MLPEMVRGMTVSNSLCSFTSNYSVLDKQHILHHEEIIHKVTTHPTVLNWSLVLSSGQIATLQDVEKEIFLLGKIGRAHV